MTINQDIKLERNLIAQLLSHLNGTIYAKACASIVHAEDFTDKASEQMWRVITQLLEQRSDINLVNAYTLAKSKGINANLALFTSVQSGNGDIVMMACVLHEMALKRNLASALTDVVLQLDNDTYKATDALADVTTALGDISKTTARSVVSWQECYTDLLHTIERRANGELPLGVNTGYWLIDKEGGFAEGDLIVVAGRTSNGKTAFALNLATNIAQAGVPVVVYSLEMTNEQVATRITANLAGVSAVAIKKAQLNDMQWSNVASISTSMPLYFDDSRASGKQEMFSAIRNVVDTRGARVVFIDYLQLMHGNGKDKRNDVGEIANDLKVLAVELHITIVLLSQLAREAKGSQPVPRINELKESGDIENASDAIYFVYRPEQHSPTLAYPDMSSDWSRYSTAGTALLICAKNRNGAMGEQLLGFDRETMRFYARTEYDLRTANTDPFAFTMP